MMCVICHERPVTCRGRCRRCYQYLLRHGADRPATVLPFGATVAQRAVGPAYPSAPCDRLEQATQRAVAAWVAWRHSPYVTQHVLAAQWTELQAAMTDLQRVLRA